MISKCPACGHTIKIGKNFCVYCGAKLTKQNGTITTTGARTQLAITNTERANLKQLIEKEKKREVIRYFKNLFKNYSYDTNLRKKIYDLIGEMLNENPEYFMKDLYIRFYRKCVYKRRKPLTPQEISEMEEYILRKFCFYRGEQLITSSFGSLAIGIYRIDGTFYVTNRRMIANGIIYNTMIGGMTDGPPNIIDLVLILVNFYGVIRGLSTPWKKRIMKKFNEIKPCFGFEFPYIGIHHIQRKKKKIKFYLKYEYKHKGETKLKTPKLGIIPLKEKDEKKRDFKKRREMVLSEINEVLNSNIGKM